MNKVVAYSATAYGVNSQWFPDGVPVNLDCSATKIAEEVINPAVGNGPCKYVPGMVWANGAPEGVTTVETVKMNTSDGFVWVAKADYAGLLAACNGCCVEP